MCYNAPMMRIAFTGHRDGQADEQALLALAAEHAGAVWVHGGAAGFDSQVSALAARLGIPQEVVRPDARQGKAAPFIRNRAVVDGADILVALYDGRKSGGTAYTVDYARRRRVCTRILAPA